MLSQRKLCLRLAVLKASSDQMVNSGQHHPTAEFQLALALLNVVIPDKLRFLVEHTLRMTYCEGLQRSMAMAEHRGPHVHDHVCSLRTWRRSFHLLIAAAGCSAALSLA